MWKVAPNWPAHPEVGIILFWHHGSLQHEFLFGFSGADLLNIKHHIKSRYAKYNRSGERYTETPTPNKREASPESAPLSPTSRLKRVKTIVNVREKPCISCNQFKC